MYSARAIGVRERLFDGEEEEEEEEVRDGEGRF